MKKKILSVILALAVMLPLFAIPATANDKWEGYIRISKSEDLELMGSYANRSGKFYLTNDIDMKDYGVWTPINGFQGTLDGNGFAIRNLTSTKGGLFGTLGTNTTNANITIKNLGLINVFIQNDGDVGALINRCDRYLGGRVNIENVYVTGKIANTAATSTSVIVNCAGGLIGNWFTNRKAALSLKNCYNAATVTSEQHAGGILGYSYDNVEFNNCVNAGEISGKTQYVGGIVAYTNSLLRSSYSYGIIRNTSTSGTVSSPGGLVGYAEKNILMQDCATSSSRAIGGDTNNSTEVRVNVPLADFKKQETYKGFDFRNIWYIHPQVNNGYPILRIMMKNYRIPAESNSTSSPEQTVNYVTTANVNLRSNPSTSSTAIVVVLKGETVRSSGSRSGWHKVTYKGQSGYINADYLEKASG
ncbi:MAG: SH3 domain-containing protein [Oscillospiraceae bacterium]|nr:SH3 domain-containing protein [Oscillospiraceae bacterium]